MDVTYIVRGVHQPPLPSHSNEPKRACHFERHTDRGAVEKDLSRMPAAEGTTVPPAGAIFGSLAGGWWCGCSRGAMVPQPTVDHEAVGGRPGFRRSGSQKSKKGTMGVGYLAEQMGEHDLQSGSTIGESRAEMALGNRHCHVLVCFVRVIYWKFFADGRSPPAKSARSFESSLRTDLCPGWWWFGLRLLPLPP